MITRIEIDGFKTFSKFSADFRPFVAVIGPNASGKSNLFDALKFLARLAATDIRQAMQDLRGEPEELFRQGGGQSFKIIEFAIEALLPTHGVDEFGTKYGTPAQRVRYEIRIELKDNPQRIFVTHEDCRIIRREEDRICFTPRDKISRSSRKTPFLETEVDQNGSPRVFVIRQDGLAESGTSKRGNPLKLPAAEASRSALSTIATSEFRHLYSLKKLLTSTQFLEINPASARKENDRFEEKRLKSDASNLAAALAEIQRKSSSELRPQGSISDLSADLAMLIPHVRAVRVINDDKSREYAFEVELRDGNSFSSRVISDGTIRLLALLTILNDPERDGVLCFEEPENGVHEGRIPDLIKILRTATEEPSSPGDYFQILINTHSPAVMNSLSPEEVLYADMVVSARDESEEPSARTRMRGVAPSKSLFDDEHHLYPEKVEELLKKKMSGI